MCWKRHGPIWATDSAWQVGGSVPYDMILIVAVWLGTQINSPYQILLLCILFLDNTVYIFLLYQRKVHPIN